MTAACAPQPPPESGLTDLVPEITRVPDPLKVYSELGFIVGDYDFPAVGRFVYLPGPADSTYAIFTFSMPNSALRFRRDDQGFLARYRVSVTVGDSRAPLAELETIQEVRVRSFRETARRDESVLFQGFLILEPGAYPATVEVRDQATRDGFQVSLDLQVKSFELSSVTEPILVYRGDPRTSSDAPPALILNPRATVSLEDPGPLVYLESTTTEAAIQLQLKEEAATVLLDTLESADSMAMLNAVIDSIDARMLPPGVLTLHAGLLNQQPADSASLVVALAPDWVTSSYAEAVSYLRYAGTFSQIDSLREAPAGERSGRLRAFWIRRDPDPNTSENEFFDRYFSRLQEANERFSDFASPGWLTDRGEVYVTLGPPDEVARHLETRQGQGQSQVWIYGDSLGLGLSLTFHDLYGTGEYRLSSDSRRAFQQAVERLYS